MKAGKIDQKIILESLAEVNTQGELVATWTAYATVWGHVISQRGAEAFEAARTDANETIRVLLRYRADVATKHRIKWNGVYYYIIAVDQSMKRAGELWLTAEIQGK